MKKGVLKTLLFYAIGFGIAGISYLTIGHPYIHAPAIHHIIIFLTLVIGIIGTLISLLLYLFKTKTPLLKGILITNSIIITACFLFIVLLVQLYKREDKPIVSEQVFSEVKGDTTRMYHNNNLIFIKVKDSILLDLR